MGEAQEIQALNNATTNLANTLGMTPEAVQAKRVQAAQNQQIDEFQNQAYTRQLQNTYAKNTAKRNVKTDETRNWIEEYQKENPIDTADPDEWVKTLQQTMREENPKLWNPSIVSSAAAQSIINSEALMKANYSIGVERGKQVAETLTGVTQNIHTAMYDPKLSQTDLDAKLAGYSMQMNDRMEAIHPGLGIQITSSGRKGPDGQPLLNIEYTDPEMVHPSMTKEEMDGQPKIQKTNMTTTELQKWGTSFLTKEGPKLAGAYAQGEQARQVNNLKSRDNATMIYDTKTDSFMQVWEVTDADNNKNWMMGKGGDLSKAVPFPSMQALMDTGRVQVISGNGKKLARNMMTDWSEDPANEGMPISQAYANRIAASVRAYETGAITGNKGKSGSDKYLKTVLDNADKLFRSDDPNKEAYLQVISSYGDEAHRAGVTEDELNAIASKAIDASSSDNIDFKKSMGEYISLAILEKAPPKIVTKEQKKRLADEKAKKAKKAKEEEDKRVATRKRVIELYGGEANTPKWIQRELDRGTAYSGIIQLIKKAKTPKTLTAPIDRVLKPENPIDS